MTEDDEYNIQYRVAPSKQDGTMTVKVQKSEMNNCLCVNATIWYIIYIIEIKVNSSDS